LADKNGVYECKICGNIVEVVKAAGGVLVCCGQHMEKLEEKSADSSTEKHVPFIIEEEDGYLVKVGENTAHPMTEEHFIQWIELTVGTRVYRKELKPGDAPEAKFKTCKYDKVEAREYCNLHGLWKGSKK
jgi:superoxide reductase